MKLQVFCDTPVCSKISLSRSLLHSIETCSMIVSFMFGKLVLPTYLVLNRDMVMKVLHHYPKFHCWKNVWKRQNTNKVTL